MCLRQYLSKKGKRTKVTYSMKKIIFRKKSCLIHWAAFLVLNIHPNQLFSQEIYENKIKNSLKEKGTPQVKLITKHGFYINQYFKTNGIKAGISHLKIFSYGLSFQWISGFKKSLIFENNLWETRYLSASLYSDFVFLKTRHWIAAVQPELSFGHMTMKNLSAPELRNSFLLVYEPYMHIQYVFGKFFSIGTGVGYRVKLVNFGDKTKGINSPYYLFNLGLFWEAIKKEL